MQQALASRSSLPHCPKIQQVAPIERRPLSCCNSISSQPITSRMSHIHNKRGISPSLQIDGLSRQMLMDDGQQDAESLQDGISSDVSLNIEKHHQKRRSPGGSIQPGNGE